MPSKVVVPRIDIFKDGAPLHSFVLTVPRLVVGSAPDASVRLAREGIQPEHLVIQLVEGRYLEAVNVAGDPSVQVFGKPFERVKLGHGTDISLFEYVFRLVYIEQDQPTPPRVEDEEETEVEIEEDDDEEEAPDRLPTAYKSSPKLVVHGPDAQNRAVRLATGNYVVGSDSCEILVPYQGVAPRHASVTVMPDGTVEVADMGSGQPTLVNRRPVGRSLFRPGDVLQVGTVRFSLESPAVEATGDTPEAIPASPAAPEPVPPPPDPIPAAPEPVPSPPEPVAAAPEPVPAPPEPAPPAPQPSPTSQPAPAPREPAPAPREPAPAPKKQAPQPRPRKRRQRDEFDEYRSSKRRKMVLTSCLLIVVVGAAVLSIAAWQLYVRMFAPPAEVVAQDDAQLLSWGEQDVPDWRRPTDIDIDPTLGKPASAAPGGGGSGLGAAPSTSMSRDDRDTLEALGEISSEIWAEEAADGTTAWVDVARVETVLHDQVTPHARMCYKRRLEEQPGLRGTMALDLVLGTDGRVTAVYYNRSSSTIEDADLQSCIERAIKSRAYPHAFGGSVTVTYPFRFSGE